MANAPENLVIATAGHVDHGKSTLVKALTSIDPDRLAEEKKRGLTIDIGFAHFQTPGGLQVGFVDLPGHHRFIRNMLAGVSSTPAALLVVAADEGVRQQTVEHLEILDLLKVEQGIVVFTKRGRAEPNLTQLQDTVAGTVAQDWPVVEVDSVQGTGLDELVKQIEELPARTRGGSRRAHLWIDRAFTIDGAGTVVTGTLRGSPLTKATTMVVAGTDQPVRLRRIQSYGVQVDRAAPGSRVACNLSGVDADAVGRGTLLTEPHGFMMRNVFGASLKAASSGLPKRASLVLHIGTEEVEAGVTVLGQPEIAPGHTGFAIVRTKRRIPVAALDRFILRDTGRWVTAAGGQVLALDVSDRRIDWLAELDRRAGSDPHGIAAFELERLVIADAGQIANLSAGAEPDVAIHEPGARMLLARLNTELVAAPKGLSPKQIGGLLGIDERTTASLIEVWVSQGHLRIADGMVRAATPDALSPDDRVRADNEIRRLAEQGVNVEPTTLESALVRELERMGECVTAAPGIVYPHAVWEAITDRVVALIKRNPEGVTVSDIREELGTSRKYAVPILEKLDRELITRRVGDKRTLGARSR